MGAIVARDKSGFARTARAVRSAAGRRHEAHDFGFGLREIEIVPFGLDRHRPQQARAQGVVGIGNRARPGRKSMASFCPRQGNNSPTQLTRTRLQWAQKLFVCGVMNPTRVRCPRIRQ